MHTVEQIELTIEALELLYTQKSDIPYYKQQIAKQLEYWYMEKTVIEIINSNTDK